MITIFTSDENDYSGLGIGVLDPMECIVEEEAAGMYEATLKQQIDEGHKAALIDRMRVLKLPAPVREGAIYESTGTVTREYYRVDGTSTGVRLRTGPGTSYKSLSTHKDGTMVLKLDQPDEDWMHVQLISGGATGYMSTKYLTLDHSVDEVIAGDKPGSGIAPVMARNQLFRIAGITKKSRDRIIEARAEHITYDLKGVIVLGECSIKNMSPSYAVAQILAQQSREHPFTINCYAGGSVSGEYGGRNIIDCLLNETDGIAAQLKARVVRDNFTIYILPGEDIRDMGAEIRYAKNMLDAEFETDYADVVTQIRPVGKTKDGEKLYIESNGGFVNSPKINDYPVIYTKEIEYNVQIGEDGIEDKEAAMAKLAELAEKDFKDGIDEPKVRIDASYVREELTEEYKNIANEQALHMYDAVHAIDPGAGIQATLQMTRYRFDALMEMYLETETSSAFAVANWTDKPENLRYIQIAQDGEGLLYSVTLAWDHPANDVQYSVYFNGENYMTGIGEKSITFENVEIGDYACTVTPYRSGETGIGNGLWIYVEDIRWKAAPEMIFGYNFKNSILISWSHSAEGVTYVILDNGNTALEIEANESGAYYAEIPNVEDGLHTIQIYASKDGVPGDRTIIDVDVSDAWKAAPTDAAAEADGADIIISWKHDSTDTSVWYKVSDAASGRYAENVNNTGIAGDTYTARYTDAEIALHTFHIRPYKYNPFTLEEDVSDEIASAVIVYEGDESWKAAPQNVRAETDGIDVTVRWTHSAKDVLYLVKDNGKLVGTYAAYESTDDYAEKLLDVSYGSHTYSVTVYKGGVEGGTGTAAVIFVGEEQWKTAPVIEFAVNNNDGSLSLVWSHDAMDAGYEIEMDGNPYATTEAGVLATLLEGLSAGDHTFRVRAVKDGEYGAYSDPVTVTITDESWKAAPTKLNAENLGSGQVRLTWEHVSSDVSYRVKADGSLLLTTAAGVKTVILENQSAGTHSYSVYAVKDGEEGSSAEVSIGVTGDDDSWKAAPYSLSGYNNNSGVVQLMWQYDGDASSFNVYVDGALVKTVSVYQAILTGVALGTRRFNVCAVKNGVEGYWSPDYTMVVN